ncbi:MAG: 6-phosphofructokinase [Bauldia sp.]
MLGARHGVRGIRNDHFIDLSDISETDLRRMGQTPSAALGSTRDKPNEEYCTRILNQLRAIAADAFIYIGGNDTAGTLQVLAAADDGKIAFVHAPKTIDNDLVENDHTPGFMSAALFVAHAFQSIDLDFRALPGIYVGVVMGRHAGFLTAASAAWRRHEADGPHLVYVPERHFSVERFLATCARCARNSAAASSPCRKGWRPRMAARSPSSLPENWSAMRTATSSFPPAISARRCSSSWPGNSPACAPRVDTFGYLPRAFSGTVSEIDRREAYDVGVHAVEVAADGGGSVTLQNGHGTTKVGVVPLAAVAGKTRLMPDDFLDPKENRVSDVGLAYLNRLCRRPRTFSHRSCEGGQLIASSAAPAAISGHAATGLKRTRSAFASGRKPMP